MNPARAALILREADVQRLCEMADVVRWVEEATRAHGQAQARNLSRQRVKLPQGTLHVLPSADLEAGVVGLKVYTSYKEATRFLILLYSAENGRLLALIEGNWLGMLRTGAASGVATKYLARPDADCLAMFGTGWQARGQVQAIACVRSLKEIRAYSRDAARRQRFADDMSRLTGIPVRACESPKAALAGAGIVATATTSSTPVFPGDAIGPGVHINAAGSNSLLRRELDETLVRRADRVVVDSRQQARLECGDLLIPAERGWIDWELLPELREVVAGHTPGRQRPDEITIFESHGLGLLDVAVAARVYLRAVEGGVGEPLRLFQAE
jgi:ornithine cyclodeaminase/alanine dehydrogenase-like protein (mu-crystallin family)